jgi:ABC-type sugar transport system substrate-binding protein
MFKIPPKGKKKISIGVLDPNASIEGSAYLNNLHAKSAKAKGWGLEYVDLKDNFAEAGNAVDNMISAGYDGIIIHNLGPKTFDKQVKKAFDKGIPIITTGAMGDQYPGVVADIGPMQAGMAALVAEFVCSKLQPADKIVTMHIPAVEMTAVREAAAKGVFQAYNRTIARELFYPLTGDPFQWAYDQTKNVLVGDSKKEIKGIWAAFEGFGVNAARAAHDLGRDDVVVGTVDDDRNTMDQIAKLPTMWAASGLACMSKEINVTLFELFDKIFKGQQVESQKGITFWPRLVTKENLPPKGYYVSGCGYKGPPDFAEK